MTGGLMALFPLGSLGESRTWSVGALREHLINLAHLGLLPVSPSLKMKSLENSMVKQESGLQKPTQKPSKTTVWQESN